MVEGSRAPRFQAPARPHPGGCARAARVEHLSGRGMALEPTQPGFRFAHPPAADCQPFGWMVLTRGLRIAVLSRQQRGVYQPGAREPKATAAPGTCVETFSRPERTQPECCMWSILTKRILGSGSDSTQAPYCRSCRAASAFWLVSRGGVRRRSAPGGLAPIEASAGRGEARVDF